MHSDTDDPKTIRISMLSYLRLSIGDMGSGPPTEEEKELIEKAFEIREGMQQSISDSNATMVVALVAAAQVLEEVLCHYQTDMPDVLNSIICKLTLHGTQHMSLEDNPPKEIKFTGTVH